MIKSAHRKS